MDALKILAWGLVASVVGVVFFVRAPEATGVSGGKQASDIINSTAKGFASIVNSAQGYRVV
jgi:hypothetical protein